MLDNHIFMIYEYLMELSQLIRKEYDGLMAAVAKTDRASVTDLIAYQIGWGKLLIGWYEAGERGEIPQMPGEGFTKWDYTAIAKHFHEKYQYDRGKKQDAEFAKVVKTILAFVEKEEKKGRLDEVGVWEWCTLASGKQWPLSKWVKVNTAAPYSRAAKLVRSIK